MKPQSRRGFDAEPVLTAMFPRKRGRQKLLLVVKGKASSKGRTLKKRQGLERILLRRAKEQHENLRK